MSGDYSRVRFDPSIDVAGVLMQQGRVQLDSDWNEWVAVLERRLRAENLDTFGVHPTPGITGVAVVSPQTPDAFKIETAGGSLTIGRGRMYVDGLLAENHGGGAAEFDPVLAELRGKDPLAYDKQPYFPAPPALPAAGKHLVYLEVWQRELTYLERPELVENAVGVDTTTRLQTVWQVRLLGNDVVGANCTTPDNQVVGWQALILPSAGRLSVRAEGMPPDLDPCELPPSGGYRGLENQLYRIEIHDGGSVGTATFKWSRENASVESNVIEIVSQTAASTEFKLASLGHDAVLRFNTGDWVEILDDRRELSGENGDPALRHGVIRKIIVDDAKQTIHFSPALPADLIPSGGDDTLAARHTRVRRWDQKGTVRDANNVVIVDLDAAGSTGLIPVPTAGVWVVLENGIQVQFGLDPSGMGFHCGDYWVSAARTADTSMETLTQAPPRGVHHHFCRLGIIDADAKTLDCRTFWPPDMGESCDCTVCVSAVSHNTGTMTLQAAVDQVKGKGGGKICVGPGIYNISKTVVIAGAGAIEIAGHGLPTLQATSGLVSMPILLIEQSIDITVQDLGLAAGMVGEGIVGPDARNTSIPGLELRNTFFIRVKRCAFMFGTNGQLIPGGRTLSPAIGVVELVVDTDISESFFNNVDVGIGYTGGGNVDSPFVQALSIEANQMICARAGLGFDDFESAVFSEIRFERNFVQSPVGFLMVGKGLDVDVESNTFNVTSVQIGFSVGIFTNISQARIENNRIFGNVGMSSNGIILGTNGTTVYGTRVTGNQINNLTGIGIAITAGALLLETIISQNELLNLGNGGIVMLPGFVSKDEQHITRNSGAMNLHVFGNSLMFTAQTSGMNFGEDPLNLVAIQLLSSINVVVTENIIENVGMDPDIIAARFGIAGFSISGLRVAGNRIANIGPSGPVSGSAGIRAESLSHRVDIVDNEVRRSTIPSKEDQSHWAALEIRSAGDVSVKGNLFEGFGSFSTVLVSTTGSCIFSENQCFSDNPTVGPTLPIVQITGAPVIASSNYVKGPEKQPSGIGMMINSGFTGMYAVLGNMVVGGISVNGLRLQEVDQIPQPLTPDLKQPLNVITFGE